MFTVSIIDAKARQMGLPYLVIGGHAVNAYWEPRSTLDIDFLVRKSDLPGWRTLLESEGYTAAPEAQTFAQFDPPYGMQTQVPKPEHLIALKLHALKHGHQERFDKDFGDVVALTRNAGLDLGSSSFRQLFEQFGSLELYETVRQRFS